MLKNMQSTTSSQRQMVDKDVNTKAKRLNEQIIKPQTPANKKKLANVY